MRSVTGPRTGATWWCVHDDPARWRAEHPGTATLLDWFADLTRPDPAQGRPGPVCPFVKPAAAHHALWIAEHPGGDTLTAADIATAADDAFTLYRALPTDGPCAVLTVFPGLTHTARIDDAHAARKTEIVGTGAMLGQFYPGCPVAGLWNRDYRPLDAPLPMLVIRPMMNTDFPFLVGEPEWLSAYLAVHAPGLPRKLRAAIAQRMHVPDSGAGSITELRAHFPDEHAQPGHERGNAGH
ncbi:hypothetical protein BOX37_24115 [Nocardia mangyaensis]|uniref:DUF6875 domain-containing protein n=1 Tax=Nocardia mangyaensis TaxID=2213200 RepID=A0A1J0VX45_9NOCA|nr:hypothetical protein BOX37_24115 [Nocardia mangyaensis]